MNIIRIVSLRIDDISIYFKNGLNYIVGENGAGKTTIFNCIKYSLGIVKSINYNYIYQIELIIHIDGVDFIFRRNIGSLTLKVICGNEINSFRARSKELDSFFRGKLHPQYIFDESTESIFEILNFCFLAESEPSNRRQQWEAFNSICGINISLLNSVEKDIYLLKKEVEKNKEFENIVENFSELLSLKLRKSNRLHELRGELEEAKLGFFKEYREKEELLDNAMLKFETIKRNSNEKLKSKIENIEEIFNNIKKCAGIDIGNTSAGIESFIKDKNRSISYGQQTLSWFILFLSIAKTAEEHSYNFPQIMINDCYLFHYQSKNKIYEIMSGNTKLQYIEFTYQDELPKEHIVFNMKERAYVFGS